MSEQKIPCDLIQDLMPLYVDGLTSEATNGQMLEHLQVCADCRKKYEAMTQSIAASEGEMKIEEQKEIDYLKKVKKSNRKKLLIGFGSAVVIVLLALFIKVYVIGYATDSYTVTNVSRFMNHSSVVVEGTFDKSRSVYCRYELTTKPDGTQKVIIYGCRPSFWHKDKDFRFEIPFSSVKQSLEVGGATIDKHGGLVSSMANQLSKAWNPYVGDMTANNRIAEILGIRSTLGDYENELQTDKKPYSWTFHFKSRVSNPNAFDEKMSAYACLLMASVGNLDKVSWTYYENVPGNDDLYTASITRKEGGELANQSIFTDVTSPHYFQILVEYLNKFDYKIE